MQNDQWSFKEEKKLSDQNNPVVCAKKHSFFFKSFSLSKYWQRIIHFVFLATALTISMFNEKKPKDPCKNQTKEGMKNKTESAIFS